MRFLPAWKITPKALKKKEVGGRWRCRTPDTTHSVERRATRRDYPRTAIGAHRRTAQRGYGVQQPLEAGCAMHAFFMTAQTALAIAWDPVGFGWMSVNAKYSGC